MIPDSAERRNTSDGYLLDGPPNHQRALPQDLLRRIFTSRDTAAVLHEALSDREAAQKAFSSKTVKLLTELEGYLNDPKVSGRKVEAVKSIIWVHHSGYPKLDLSHLELNYLPSAIGELDLLEEIDLSDNKLHSLPRDVEKLPNIKYIDATGNDLKYIPFQITNIKGLKSICVDEIQVTSQDWLKLLMDRLGYKLSGIDGLCDPYVHMASQAMLAEDMASFDNRIEYIHKLNNLHDAHLREVLESDLSMQTDLHSFFDGIYLYNEEVDDKYQILVPNGGRIQRLTNSLLHPVSLKEGIHLAANTSAVVSKNDLATFFSNLKGIILKNEQIVALRLISSNHAIAVSYDRKDHCWVLCDANGVNSERFVSEEELASQVFTSLGCLDSENILLEILGYTKGGDKTKEVRELCETLVDINPESIQVLDEKGQNWLMLATLFGQLDTVKSLLKHKWDLDHQSREGFAALHIASSEGYFDIATELLKHNPCINLTTNLGQTPVRAATFHGRREIVKLLLHHGADIRIEDDCKQTPLFLASTKGFIDILKDLLEYDSSQDIDVVKVDGSTSLMGAAGNGHIEAVRELLKYSPDVNKANVDGTAALFTAACNGHLGVVRELMKWKANVNQPRHDGITPLIAAACNGHLGVVQELLQHKPDVHHVSKAGLTAQLVAEGNKHDELARVLSEYIPPSS